MHRVYHTKEVCVNFAERNQIFARELLRQVVEHVVARDDLSSLPLTWPQAEALRRLNRRVLFLHVPLEQKGEARRDGLLQEDLLLDECEEPQPAQPRQRSEVTRLVSTFLRQLLLLLHLCVLWLQISIDFSDRIASARVVEPGRGLKRDQVHWVGQTRDLEEDGLAVRIVLVPVSILVHTDPADAIEFIVELVIVRNWLSRQETRLK